jgi:hypothetical protein
MKAYRVHARGWRAVTAISERVYDDWHALIADLKTCSP